MNITSLMSRLVAEIEAREPGAILAITVSPQAHDRLCYEMESVSRGALPKGGIVQLHVGDVRIVKGGPTDVEYKGLWCARAAIRADS